MFRYLIETIVSWTREKSLIGEAILDLIAIGIEREYIYCQWQVCEQIRDYGIIWERDREEVRGAYGLGLEGYLYRGV